MLGYIMEGRSGIAVSGTHGKTTTSSMIAHMLDYAQLDPTIVIGGQLNGIMSNARLGKSDYMVVEADESDASFLYMNPNWIIVTSVDVDVNLNIAPYSHLNFDYEKTLNNVKDAFFKFIDKLSENGKAIVCIDDENLKKMLPEIDKNYITYGISSHAQVRAENIELKNFGSSFDVVYEGSLLGRLNLQVPGYHNVQNALAVLIQGLELGLNFEIIREALYNFCGVKRRFERIGEVNEVLIVDDYAHNPGKIQALLSGACTGERQRVIAVFQPHRYTRTKFLYQDFVESFFNADILVVTEIYGAGECPIVGIRGETLAQSIENHEKRPKKVEFIPHQEEIVKYLTEIARPGDIVITCGAGDIHETAESLKTNLYNIQAQTLKAV